MRYHTRRAACALAIALATPFAAAQIIINEDRALTAKGEPANIQFGEAVATDGVVCVVGAPSDDEGASGAGAAYLFDVATGVQLVKLVAPDAQQNDMFGSSVAIEGNTVVVGSPRDNDAASDAGSVYVFDTETGKLRFELFAADPGIGDLLGVSVAIDRGLIAVGAVSANNTRGRRTGAVYLFDAVTGAQLRKLTANGVVEFGQLGRSVALDGNLAIAGAPEDDSPESSAGSAWVFNTDTGEILDELNASDAGPADRFGAAVAIDGGTIVVGAPGDTPQGTLSGSAYVFRVSDGRQMYKVTPNRHDGGDRFGIAVSVSGGVAAIGEQGDDENGGNAGAAALFDVETGAQTARLLPNVGQLGATFGASVVTLNGLTIVGSPTFGALAGRAYVFGLDAGGGERCVADFDGNGVVNSADVGAFLSEWFPSQGACP